MNVLFSVFIHIITFFTIRLEKQSVPSVIMITPTLTPSATPTPNPTSTPFPTNPPTPSPRPNVTPRSNSLLSQVNGFRRRENLPLLVSDSKLCSIAKERVEYLARRGGLDNHEGYRNYHSNLQQSFHQWWETLFFASPPKVSHDVVFSFWANSPGHKQALLSTATYGCGAEKDGYAVFELGRK